MVNAICLPLHLTTVYPPVHSSVDWSDRFIASSADFLPLLRCFVRCSIHLYLSPTTAVSWCTLPDTRHFYLTRTKDLIEVVIQLNEKKGFLAVTMFHTERLQVYPTIFVDPAKVRKPRTSCTCLLPLVSKNVVCMHPGLSGMCTSPTLSLYSAPTPCVPVPLVHKCGRLP